MVDFYQPKVYNSKCRGRLKNGHVIGGREKMSRRYKRSNNCFWPFLFHSNDEKMIYPIWCRRDLIICKRTSRSIPFSPNGTERADFLQHRGRPRA